MKNPCNKERRLSRGDKPYATWTDARSGWRYELLKSWQGDNSKAYARWFVNVHGYETEMGDTYVADLVPGLLPLLRSNLTVDTSVFENTAAFIEWAFGAI